MSMTRLIPSDETLQMLQLSKFVGIRQNPIPFVFIYANLIHNVKLT